jgi:glycosyltransferase involved in cell wall biosynthesis
VRHPVGGIRTYIRYHYPSLARSGYQFTFVGPDDVSFSAFRDEFRDWEGVEFVTAELSGRTWHSWRKLRWLLRTRRFDLVHSHGLTAAVRVVLANLGVGIGHVATLHDVFRDSQFPGRIGELKLLILTQLLARIDMIISVSHDAERNLTEYLPRLAHSRCRLAAIVNGIDTEHFSERCRRPEDGLRRAFRLEADCVLIGFLGRCMEQKGFLLLLDALERLANDKCMRPYHVVAISSGGYELEYQEETVRRNLRDKITFLQSVSDIAPILRQIDLLVMPSLWEACPLLPMEAMVAGVPVLGSDCVGLREVLHSTPSVLVPVGDALAWSRALASAIAEPWTEAARDFVHVARQRFSAAESGKRLQELVDELCARSSGREGV